MDRSSKEAVVAELKELIVGRTSVVLTDYKGLTVAQMYELRREFDKVGAGYRVVKNTLAKLALAGTDYEFLGEELTGTIGIAYSDDAVAPAKVLAKFSKEFEKLTVKVGYLDGNKIQPEDLEALSKLPGKDELRARLLSVFNAPATKFVGVIAAAPRDFVGVLRARSEALAG
jgi:large subunit ribosomal protein L10